MEIQKKIFEWILKKLPANLGELMYPSTKKFLSCYTLNECNKLKTSYRRPLNFSLCAESSIDAQDNPKVPIFFGGLGGWGGRGGRGGGGARRGGRGGGGGGGVGGGSGG